MSNKLIYTSLAALLFLGSCADDNYPSGQNNGQAIAFETAPLKDLRATIASENTFKSFTASAFGCPDAGDYDKYVINGATVTRSEAAGSAWDYFPPAFFPLTGKTDFFAYAPASSVNITPGTGLKVDVGSVPTPVAAGPSIGYSVSPDAEKQEDFMVAKTAGLDNTSGTVNLDFKHALSRIEFKARNTNTNKNIVIETIEISNLYSKGTLLMKDSLPNGTDPFVYPNNGSGYKILWKDRTDRIDYAVDLGSTNTLVPYSPEGDDTYFSLTNQSNGLFVMPQETILGAFNGLEKQGSAGEKSGDADATYLVVTYAEVDPATKDIVNNQTVYFLVADPYNASKGIVFEAGRKYTFSFTLTNGRIAFDPPQVSDMDTTPGTPSPTFPGVVSVTLDPSAVQWLQQGDQITVTANAVYPEWSEISYRWSSSDPAIANYLTQGSNFTTINAMQTGTTNITVTAGDAISANLVVNVAPAIPASLTPSVGALTEFAQTLTLTAAPVTGATQYVFTFPDSYFVETSPITQASNVLTLTTVAGQRGTVNAADLKVVANNACGTSGTRTASNAVTICNGIKNSLCWLQPVYANTQWAPATAACETMGFRLPTKDELVIAGTAPVLLPTLWNNRWYWTSSTENGGWMYALCLDDQGSITDENQYLKSANHNYRCVKSI
ncbi:MAG: fimbrillin family protein [Candidatus Symbiothrix sp.]|jgi:hypothetical protein|nr:fimbrillin family protein [Candidatus Symbiothrix sp.]